MDFSFFQLESDIVVCLDAWEDLGDVSHLDYVVFIFHVIHLNLFYKEPSKNFRGLM